MYDCVKIFDRDNKTNFVDTNNCLVGVDNQDKCCENFRWYVTESIPTEHSGEIRNSVLLPEPDNDGVITLDDYRFDPYMFHEDVWEDKLRQDAAENIAVFRLIGPIGKPTLYVVLANSHNGYYSHKFVFHIGGEIPRRSSSI